VHGAIDQPSSVACAGCGATQVDDRDVQSPCRKVDARSFACSKNAASSAIVTVPSGSLQPSALAGST
jgi:hypothetical protein